MARIHTKLELPIASLPDSCFSKAQLVSYVKDPSRATVWVVLVAESSGFAGYIGYPDRNELCPEYATSSDAVYNCNKIRNPDQVARLGNLLGKDTTKVLFPSVKIL